MSFGFQVHLLSSESVEVYHKYILKSNLGFTSLRHAVAGEYSEVVKILLENGADVNGKDDLLG